KTEIKNFHIFLTMGSGNSISLDATGFSGVVPVFIGEFGAEKSNRLTIKNVESTGADAHVAEYGATVKFGTLGNRQYKPGFNVIRHGGRIIALAKNFVPEFS